MLKDLILNHSFSRIIQTLLKHSSSSQREYIAQQLEGSYKQLSESRYSRFLVCKIMKLVSAERRWKIMDEFSGSVVGMVRHKEAGKVLAEPLRCMRVNGKGRCWLVGCLEKRLRSWVQEREGGVRAKG
jgi:pumilio family protein 6